MQKESQDEVIKNIRNLFKLKIKKRTTKHKIIRDTKTFFQQQEEGYYKPVRVGNFWNNNYTEYENNGDRKKNLSIEEHLLKSNHI